MKMAKLVSLVCALFLAVAASAQFGFAPEDVQITVTPQTPAPGENVQVTVESYSTDLNRARISYAVDGVIIEQELGLRNFNFNSPGVGGKTTLQVVVETIDKGTVRKELAIQPAALDLVFEPLDSYVPPFYEGKPLNAHESGIKLVALPYFVNTSGGQIDPKSLVYKWSVSNKVQVADSGYGKSTFIFKGSTLYRTKSVTVTVEDVEGSIRAVRTVELPAYLPKIVFYSKSAVTGVNYRQALDDEVSLGGTEELVQAVPYFFSDLDQSEYTSYEWLLNGKTLASFGDRNEITLRSEEGQAGTAVISLEVLNSRRILQIADNTLRVLFGQTENTQQQSNATAQEESRNFFGF